MPSRKDRKIAAAKLTVLGKKGIQYEVDYSEAYSEPPSRPVERALRVLSCGFDLLVRMSDTAFPSLDRRIRKDAAKWTLQHLVWAGIDGAMVLAHALPMLMAEMNGDLSDDESAASVPDAEHHRDLLKAVRGFYTLPRKRTEALELALAEFKVIETHEPRPKVASGDEVGSEYSRALMEGVDPGGDKRLVDAQRRYARDYFISRASVAAIDSTMDPRDRERVEGKLIEITDPDAPGVPEYRALALRSWIEGSKSYRDYVLLERQHSAATESA